MDIRAAIEAPRVRHDTFALQFSNSLTGIWSDIPSGFYRWNYVFTTSDWRAKRERPQRDKLVFYF
jgi:hypothetical protein